MSHETSFICRSGSVIGRDHAAVGRNNQDGVALLQREQLWVAVVTDGCSAGGSSEVGAKLGARWIARALAAAAPAASSPEALADALGASLRAWLQVQLEGLTEAERAAELTEHWLFTFLAAVVTPERALILGVGDGLLAADAQLTVLDPGPENAPPYAAYALLEGAPELTVRLHVDAPTDSVDALVIATDGLAPCPEALPTLAADPAVLANPFALQRRLNVLSRARRLGDDCTLALLRRRPA